MKKYIQFLLEGENDIVFDYRRYNKIIGSLKNFKGKNLYFSDFDTEELNQKRSDKKYKEYWLAIDKELRKRKINDVVSTLYAIGFQEKYKKEIENVINEILDKDPTGNIVMLAKSKLKEEGIKPDPNFNISARRKK